MYTLSASFEAERSSFSPTNAQDSPPSHRYRCSLKFYDSLISLS